MQRKEEAMNMKVLGAIVIAASALSSSAALAQALSHPDLCEDEFSGCTGLGTGSTPTSAPRYRHLNRRTAYYRPAPATGAMVGGPGNSYAMYGGAYGWNGSWNAYATRNGIVCRPGTYYKGADGLQHPCQ
jgi:hypothetical protein